MPPVGHLDRLWRPRPDALGVRAGPVTAHDLDTGMGAQPGGKGVGGPVVQHVDRPVGVHVEQQCRVGVPAALGEIVHAQHRDLADLRVGQGPDHADGRVA
jgi:hypothetical protein